MENSSINLAFKRKRQIALQNANFLKEKTFYNFQFDICNLH